MAWTTPRTWAAEVLTSTLLNSHLRDNLNALKTAKKITTATKTTDTTFSTTNGTVCSFSYTFSSSATYLVTGHCYAWTSNTASTVNAQLGIYVNGTLYGVQRSKSNGTAASQSGMSATGIISGLSGTYTVSLEAYADTGSGHTITAHTTAPAVLTLTQVDVV